MTFQLPESAEVYRSVFLMEVTPELAYQWLGRNMMNRKLDPATVDRYYRQIVYGKWRRTHQGIAFDQDGILVDGQHRLAAVCKAKKAVQMLVFVNQSLTNHEVIDDGKARTNLDVIQLELQDSQIRTKHLSTLRAMRAGRLCKNPNWSSKELNDEYKYHYKAIRFAVEQMENAYSSRIDDPTVRGVIARAFYNVDESKLRTFCYTLANPYGETAIISELGNWLMKLTDHREGTRREIYRRTEYTLLAFLQERDVVTIPFATRELFPLK